tara:strand:+ start:429 stop:1442 length:1014 start_codon:yes stop_codon:yes gene_type:complete
VATSLYPLRNFQLGLEGTQGTLVAATKKVEGVTVVSEDQEVFRRQYPTGVRMPNDQGGVTVKNGVGVSHAAPLDYEQILYPLLAGVVNDAVPAGGSAPYTWSFPITVAALGVLKTVTAEFVIEDGSTKHYQREMGFGVCRRMAFIITPGEMAQFEADYFFRASQASTVTGSLSPIAGRADVPASLFKLFIDSSWGNLGNTAITPGFRTATIEILTGHLPDYTADQRTDLDFTAILPGLADVNVSLTMEHNAAAATRVAAARAHTVEFFRFDANNGGGGTALRSILIDLALAHREPPAFSEEDGIELVTFTYGLEYDVTGSQGMNINVKNALATQGAL